MPFLLRICPVTFLLRSFPATGQVYLHLTAIMAHYGALFNEIMQMNPWNQNFSAAFVDYKNAVSSSQASRGVVLAHVGPNRQIVETNRDEEI